MMSGRRFSLPANSIRPPPQLLHPDAAVFDQPLETAGDCQTGLPLRRSLTSASSNGATAHHHVNVRRKLTGGLGNLMSSFDHIRKSLLLSPASTTAVNSASTTSEVLMDSQQIDMIDIENDARIDEDRRLRIVISDLNEENRMMKEQMQAALDAIAQLEDDYGRKQEKFMQWHQEEITSVITNYSTLIDGLNLRVIGLEGKLTVSHDEVVRLSAQLADEIDAKGQLQQNRDEMSIQMADMAAKMEQLQKENDRLSLTIVRIAKDRTDLQSKCVMTEHDLETMKTKVFEAHRIVEGYKQRISDLESRINLSHNSSNSERPKGDHQKPQLPFESIPL